MEYDVLFKINLLNWIFLPVSQNSGLILEYTQAAMIHMLSKMLRMPVNITPPFREKQRQQRSGHCGHTPQQHMLKFYCY